ncbi:hypothetical protein B9Z19DRAFT_1038640 [Tuber borchii]|uniref:Uncharacterized protein n=1 Tax=Tuber borchii TaxID=42251 RepID=A0A2T7A7P0_TUBBO|nr:hypothetical protein B9Z19DRAFT_1038640 [Tuber borchii]
MKVGLMVNFSLTISSSLSASHRFSSCRIVSIVGVYFTLPPHSGLLHSSPTFPSIEAIFGYSTKDKASLKLRGYVEARQASLNYGTITDPQYVGVDSPEAAEFVKTARSLSSRHIRIPYNRRSNTRGNQSVLAKVGPLLMFLAYYFVLFLDIDSGFF